MGVKMSINVKKVLFSIILGALVSTNLSAFYDDTGSGHTPPPPFAPAFCPPGFSSSCSDCCCDQYRLYGGWLYWKLGGDEYEYAVVKTRFFGPDGEVLDRENFHDIKFDWNDGFRLGFGVDNCCLGFDFDLIWTHFHSKTSASKSVLGLDPPGPGGSVFVALPVVDSVFVTLAPGNEAHFDAHERFHFDIVDFEFSKWFDFCNLGFRPYVGLRFADIQESFGDELEIFSTGTSFVTNYDFHNKNKFKGVGILAGFDVDYRLCDGLSILGTLGGSVVWGRTHLKNHFGFDRNDLFDAYNSEIKEHYRQFKVITDFLIGLRYDTCFCGCYPVDIILAWEQHYIFKQHRFVVDDSFLTNITSTTATSSWYKDGTTFIQGLTLEAGIRF